MATTREKNITKGIARLEKELAEKNRELEIEAAVERVRARALAMHKSEEILSVVFTMRNELQLLNIPGVTAATITLKQDDGSIRLWDITSADQYKDGFKSSLDVVFRLKDTNPRFYLNRVWKSRKKYFVVKQEEKDFPIMIDWMRQFDKAGAANVKRLIKKYKIKLAWHPAVQLSHGRLNVDSALAPESEMETILLKMGAAFDLAYKRFLDLKNAEAQAREAQVEVSLERVRARAMSMQSSEELADLVATVFKELTALGFALTSSIIWIHDRNDSSDTLWIASAEANKPAKPFRIKPFHNAFFKSITHAWNARDFKWVYTLKGQQKKTFEKAFFKELPDLPAALRKALINPKQVVFSASFNNFGALEIVETEPLTDEKFDILHRFGKVFNISYTRFNDLKKAEAQAREAQIEAALEKIRSTSLAMHSSSELKEVIAVTFEKLNELNVLHGTVGIQLFDWTTMNSFLWVGNNIQEPQMVNLPYDKKMLNDDSLVKDVWQAMKKGVDIINKVYSFKQKNRFFNYIFSHNDLIQIPEAARKLLLQMKNHVVCLFTEKNSALFVDSFQGELFTADDQKIIKRTAKVFEQAYIRFLDLQKAETQAREARIEAALERVRARTMGMHHSKELHDVIETVTNQLLGLGLEFNSANFCKINKDKSWELWLSTPQQAYPSIIHVPYLDHGMFHTPYDDIDFFTDVYDQKEAGIFFHHFFENTDARHAPEERKQFVYNSKGFSRTGFLAKDIWVVVSRYDIIPFTDEENAIIKRFAKVFEQSYTRFLDLQKAEAQAKEAEIELALERVRAKTMAMQKPSEFVDVVNEIGEQLVHLDFDIEWVNFSASGLNVSKGIDIWNFAVLPGNQHISSRLFIPYFEHPVFTQAAKELDEYIRTGKDFFTTTLNKKDKDSWLDQMYTQTFFKDVPEELKVIQYAKPGYTTSNIGLKDTWLSIGKLDIKTFTDEQHAILKRFGKAFGLAYTRFEDLQKAETQAREAQIQLSLERVRSRAMAMHSSDELSDVLSVLFEQFDVLDIKPNHAILSLVDLEKSTVVFRLTGKAGKRVFAQQTVDLNAMDIWKELVERWKKDGPDAINLIHYPKEVLPQVWQIFAEVINAIPEESRIKVEDFPDGMYNTEAYCQFGYIGFCHTRFATEEEKNILTRFATEFGRLYQRFLDLQNAEAQAREAQIEAGLERVRSRAMAMQTSEELNELIGTVFTELTKLDLVLTRCVIWVFDPATDSPRWWMANSEEPSNPMNFLINYHEHPAFLTFLQEWKKQNIRFVYDLRGQDKISWDDILFNETELVNLPAVVKKGMRAPERVLLSASFNNFGGINVASLEPLSDEHFDILLRFAKVFDLTYTRFNDLKQAEAQAKESQIQLALERVRARTMAMQKSEELRQVVSVLFAQMKSLGFEAFMSAIILNYKERKEYDCLMASDVQSELPDIYRVPYFENHFMQIFIDSFNEGVPYKVLELSGKDKQDYDRQLFTNTDFKRLPEESKQMMLAVKSCQLCCAYMLYGCIEAIGNEPLLENDALILQRFAKVFEQTYTRFLDLQKAEAQAREAEIELALERVRARTMAMHHSEEIADIVGKIFTELQQLDLVLNRVLIWIFNDDEKYISWWSANPEAKNNAESYRIDYNEQPVFLSYLQAWKKRVPLHLYTLSGENKKNWEDHLFSNTELSKLPAAVRKGMREEGTIFTTSTISDYGLMMVGSFEPLSNENTDIIQRFGRVFQQSYTRYLDVQKAEAQTRESQIQLALERVRARTMAMQKSEELPETSLLLFQQMKEFGETVVQNSIGIIKEEEGFVELSTTVHGHLEPKTLHVPINDPHVMAKAVAAWKAKRKSLTLEFKGQELKDYNELRNSFLETKVNFPEDNWIVNIVFFSKGWLSFSSNHEISKESFQLLERFAGVFDLTYTRFLDLKQAEGQARESQIQLALERVRARTMAMQKSEELQETAYILFQQFKELGEDPVQITIGIFNEEERKIEFSITGLDDSGSKIDQSYKMDIDEPILMSGIFKAWKEQRTSTVFELSGKELADWIAYRNKLGGLPQSATPVNYEDRRSVCAGFFSKGFISFSKSGAISNETIVILERFAGVFDLTYTRFLDLKQAEAQAQEAQIQLALERVRARTMAMYKSDELAQVATVMFEQISLLDDTPERFNVRIVNEAEKAFEFWTTDQEGHVVNKFFKAEFDKSPIVLEMYSSWKTGQKILIQDLYGDQLSQWIHYIKDILGVPFNLEHLKEHRFISSISFSHGMIGITTNETPHHQTLKLIERFAKTFEQTYTRFLDLQKAEAQAREAQIEASLERVRSKTMAMHNSHDVAETVSTMFDELTKLGIETIRCGVGILHEGYQMELWTAKPDANRKVELIVGHIDMKIHPLLTGGYENWKNGKDNFSYELRDDDLIAYFNAINNNAPGYSAKYDISSLPSEMFHYEFNFNEGCLFAFSVKQFSTEASQIFKRFTAVFGQTYRRYLDLEKAEAQAREAQIEASLERVRSKAMAMHKSEDLNSAVATVFDELQKLNLDVMRCGIPIFNKETRTGDVWATSLSDQGSAVQLSFPDESFDIHPLLHGAFEAWLKQDDFSYTLQGDDLTFYYEALQKVNFKLPTSQTILSDPELKQQYYHIATFQSGGLFAFRETPFPEEAKKIMKRLASVFELTYKRFLDLQKAEGNAREAQIEAGLERVRARTMAMHSSDDVSVATATMFTELEKLGIQNLRGGITIIRPDQTQEVWSVTNLSDGRVIRAIGVFDMRLHPLWRNLYEGKQRNDDYQYYWMAGQDKEDYINILNATPNYLVQPIKDFPDIHVQSYFFGEGAVWTNSLQPHSEEDKQIMKRFAGVFGQTYRRYLDLQKAEAQAREAQIEAALEKVRASTMAMQKSEDLSEAAFVLFKQLKELGESPERIFIATFDNTEETVVDIWGTNQGGNQLNKLFRVSADEPTVTKKIINAWKEKKNSVVIDLKGDELKSYLQFLESTGIPVTPGIMTERRVQTVACFSKGVIGLTTPEPRPAASIQLLERFANVFDLTYTRFLDLLQAEAQAREATIEAALEKVRGKAMAMHNSNDLSATASMVFTELRKLGINPIRCGVGIINRETHKGQLYTATTSADGDNLSVVGWVLLKGHPVLENIYEKFVQGEDYFPELTGDSMKLYYEQLLAGLSVPLPEFMDEQKHYGHFFNVSVGCLYTWSDVRYNDDEIKILRRFASIIDLTFRRYFELQKSEENAKEAVKQAALDRIRADIASMRTINDLDRITPLIWNELTILGIPFIRCGVFIMDERQQLIHTFLSTPDGKAIAAFHLPYDTPGNLALVVSNWKNKKKYIDHWDEKEFYQFAEILVEQGALDSAENYLKTIPKGGFDLHFLPFLQGMLYVGNTSQLNEEQIELIQHVADAFSTAYARYEDFNRLEAAKQQVENTLSDLKQAQQQLVQSEKMASLGELTAGIAHEIQNPLNFVNNFSDVSNELLEEMKQELSTGNTQQAIEIANDVIDNLDKILHHGKRADAIVKGMLQHSRTSSGQKEMTDINILADEYLRLAFHGLRAKDKTFNAKFETHFDNNIGKINVIPQDIGRVILNLINNAFYTVTEKKKVNQNGYEPTVTVTTLKDNGRIEIKVKDNGNGIPQKVLDKIFQPFFTTKPTGQGTGLGLSLAYDIVTKGHGGELKVETKEGEGSEFTIQLPIVDVK